MADIWETKYGTDADDKLREWLAAQDKQFRFVLAKLTKTSNGRVRKAYIAQWQGEQMQAALRQEEMAPSRMALLLFHADLRQRRIALQRMDDAHGRVALKMLNRARYDDPEGLPFERLLEQASAKGLTAEAALASLSEACISPAEPVVKTPAHDALDTPRVWIENPIRGEPWRSEGDRDLWTIKLHDFPREPLYSLHIDGRLVLRLEDWPKKWERPALVRLADEQRAAKMAARHARKPN